jgi:hypothetical protein
MQWIPAKWNLPIIKISGEGVFETQENCDRLNKMFTDRHDKNCVIIFEGMEYTPSEGSLYSPCSELIQHLISKGYYVYAFVSDAPPEQWKGESCYFSNVRDPSETTTKLMNVEYNLGNFRKTNLSIDKYKQMPFTFTVVDMDLKKSTELNMSGDIEGQLGNNYICVIDKNLVDDSGGGLAAGGSDFLSRKSAGDAQKGSKQNKSKQKVKDLQQLTQSTSDQLSSITSTVPLGTVKAGAADAFSASLPNLSGLPPPPVSGLPPPPGSKIGGTVRRNPKTNLTRRLR